MARVPRTGAQGQTLGFLLLKATVYLTVRGDREGSLQHVPVIVDHSRRA